MTASYDYCRKISFRGYKCSNRIRLSLIEYDPKWINLSISTYRRRKIRMSNELSSSHNRKSTYALSFYRSSFHLTSPKAKVHKLISAYGEIKCILPSDFLVLQGLMEKFVQTESLLKSYYQKKKFCQMNQCTQQKVQTNPS